MRLRVIAVALLLTWCQAIPASPPVSLRLSQLYEGATTVAVFEILEGKMVSPGGQWCGARYKARVVDGIKNAVRGADVEFGYLPHLKIGSSYLLLLGELEPPPPVFQTEDEFRKGCRPMLPAAAIKGLWRGAMEVEGDTRDPNKRATWTVQPVGYVEYPIGTRTNGLAGAEKRMWYTDLIKRLVAER